MSIRGAEPSLTANVFLVYFMLHMVFECAFNPFWRFWFLVTGHLFVTTQLMQRWERRLERGTVVLALCHSYQTKGTWESAC